MQPFRMGIGESKWIHVARGEYLGRRSFTSTSNSLICANGNYYTSYGNYQNYTEQNSVATPVKVYGVY